jgi:hypothetical protein
MGVIPLRSDVHTATGADDCRLCAQIGARGRIKLSAKQHLRQMALPGALVGAGMILAFVDGGALAWIGGGVAAGVVSAAGYLWVRRDRERRAAHDAHAVELRASAEEADRRVELVIRQFEWAVNDVAKLRRDLGHAESTVQALTERARQREHQMEQLVRQISQLRERLAEVAMAASATERAAAEPVRSSAEAIRFNFGLHLDGPRARLELQTAANGDSPTRLRVMDRDGQIVSVSGMAVVSIDGMLEFQLEPPLDLIADLDEGREINYAIEALVDEVWKPVRLRDTGRRTHNAVDIHGQLTRVVDVRDATRLIESAHERRSTLN